jgi:5-methylcytosine-specific restriction protein A
VEIGADACPACAPRYRRTRWEAREKTAARGYGAAHRRWRAAVFRRKGRLCAPCARAGRTTPATEVHHIRPIRTHPHLARDPDNGLPVCRTCHEMVERDGWTPTPADYPD